MNNKITIVTHHYVRDMKNLQESRVGSYSISISDFTKRLDYFIKQYSIITPNMFINSIKYNAPLPENAMLLTFDDGYIDHYNNVFPILMQRGIKAFFFPSAKPIFEKKMLNTNKLQLILDIKDKEFLHSEILKIVREICNGSVLKLFEDLNYIDNILEKEDLISSYLEWEVPINTANNIIDLLFNKLIHSNEKELCSKLYMSFEQLVHMKENGMSIGCHGYSHYCMSYLTDKIKADEINKSLKLMKLINGSIRNWVMSYPYGAFDRNLISIIKRRGCIAGFTTIEKNSDPSVDKIYTLPRVDISSSRL